MRVNLLKPVVLLALLTGWIAPAVSAQAPPGREHTLEEALAPGMTVWLTDATGREEKTRIVAVSHDLVTTAAGDGVRRLPPPEVRRIRVRQSDPLIDGALIGAGAAVAAGLFLCTRTEPWENCRDDVGPMLRIGAIGAGVGLAIDAVIRGRRTIYDAGKAKMQLHAAPIVSRHAGGLQVSLRF